MKWLVLREGGERGPFALEEMQQLLAIGSLKETDAVRPEGSDEWISLAKALTQDSPLIGIRKLYIDHEGALRSISTLYHISFLGAALGVCGLVLSVFPKDNEAPLATLTLAVFLAAWAAFFLWLGYNMSALRRKVVLPASIVAVIGLLGFPFGTLINGYILYLLHSAKGTYVFSDAYRKVIAATPDIKYRTPPLMWVIIGGIVISIIVALGIWLKSFCYPS